AAACGHRAGPHREVAGHRGGARHLGGRPVEGGGTAGERLPVVLAQNGVANEPAALRRFARVHPVCVWLPATHLEPGVVVANGHPHPGMLHIGRYPSGADDTTGRSPRT
ncbi:hypothetical protein QTS76_02020, partial [Micromonospora sp. b486]|nr:hypothetical protein [Micromonospora sp. b486]